MKHFLHHTIKESIPNLLDGSQGHASSPAGVEGLNPRAEALLPSVRASDGLHGEVHGDPPPSGIHGPSINSLVTSAKSFAGNPIALVGNVTSAATAARSVAGATHAIGQAVHTVESAPNPIALASDVASAVMTGAATAAKTLPGPGHAVEHTVHTIESSAVIPIALVGDAASTAATGAANAAKVLVGRDHGIEQTAHAIKSSATSPIAVLRDVASATTTGATTVANSVDSPGYVVERTVNAIESSALSPIALVGNVTNTTATATTTVAKTVAGVGHAARQTVHTIKSSATDSTAVVGDAASAAASNATNVAKSVAGAGLAFEQTVASAAATGTRTAVSGASLAIGQTVHAIESSATNSITLVGNMARDAATGTTRAIEDRTLALVLGRLRAIFFFYAAKLPIVGTHFKRRGGSNIETLVTESTPLLGGLHSPGAFATQQTRRPIWRLLSALLRFLPCGLSCGIFAECCVLARDVCGRLLVNLQEHSLVVAPIVSLGHLSTTNLAASTIGTAVASVTGYSVIQGFVSSLDKTLQGASNRHVAMLACAQVAIVTGIVLVPITAVWVMKSASLLLVLGQPPEIAGPAGEFLQIAAMGLPGYAIGEIAKRYLTSQDLSHVHERILSIIAPLNLGLTYLLVVGPIPTLRLGFVGAPLCTVLSYNTLAIILMVYVVQRARRDRKEHVRGHNTVESTASEVTFFAGLGALIFAGLSGVLKNASQIWSKDLGGGESKALIFLACILGPNALATQAVVLATTTTVYQAPKAVNNASSERIKGWVAKGKVRRVKIAVSAAFLATLGGASVICCVLLAFATSWGMLFSSDSVIVQNVSTLLPVIAVFQTVHGLGAWVDGALGTLGKTAVFPSLNASADYFLGIPLGVYLALLQQWGLAGLWVGLTASLGFSCLVATVVLVKTDWKEAMGTKGEDVPQEHEEAHPYIQSRIWGAFV